MVTLSRTDEGEVCFHKDWSALKWMDCLEKYIRSCCVTSFYSLTGKIRYRKISLKSTTFFIYQVVMLTHVRNYTCTNIRAYRHTHTFAFTYTRNWNDTTHTYVYIPVSPCRHTRTHSHSHTHAMWLISHTDTRIHAIWMPQHIRTHSHSHTHAMCLINYTRIFTRPSSLASTHAHFLYFQYM